VQIFYEFCNESLNGNWVEKAKSKWFIISKRQYLIHRDSTLSIKLRNDDIIHFIHRDSTLSIKLRNDDIIHFIEFGPRIQLWNQAWY
jgi:hypothetical protein